MVFGIAPPSPSPVRKRNDLPVGHRPALKPALNVAGMRALMRVLILLRALCESVQRVFVVMVVMVVLMIMIVVVMFVFAMLHLRQPAALSRPCPPEHPARRRQNNDGGNKL